MFTYPGLTNQQGETHRVAVDIREPQTPFGVHTVTFIDGDKVVTLALDRTAYKALIIQLMGAL